MQKDIITKEAIEIDIVTKCTNVRVRLVTPVVALRFSLWNSNVLWILFRESKIILVRGSSRYKTSDYFASLEQISTRFWRNLFCSVLGINTSSYCRWLSNQQRRKEPRCMRLFGPTSPLFILSATARGRFDPLFVFCKVAVCSVSCRCYMTDFVDHHTVLRLCVEVL